MFSRLHMLPALSVVATLCACGGGGGGGTTTDTSGALTGPMGQVTALAVGVLQTGTYPLSDCQDAVTSQPVNRKLRLGTDGSIALLDADNNDAPLTTLTPDNAARQSRSLSVDNARSRWSFQFESYAAGNTIQTPDINFDIRTTSAFIEVRNETTGAITGGATCRNIDSTAIVSVPVVLTEAHVAQRLASAVALNNNGDLSASFGGFNLRVSTQGEIATSLNTNPVVPWASGWLSTGNYGEDYDATAATGTNVNNANSPANPYAGAFASGSREGQGFVQIDRNTSANNTQPGLAVQASSRL